MRSFRSFHAGERRPGGVEAEQMMRKGEVKRSGGGDAAGRARFVESLSGVGA